MRRIQSLVPGDHITPQVGAGTELALIRPYQPGDDVRYIDWNVTARMREPHVRVHVGERAMTAWLMLDVSPSMQFGTALRRKADVAEGVALAVGHVATRRGNRLGVVAFGGAEPRVLRPRQGRAGLLGLLAELRNGPARRGRRRDVARRGRDPMAGLARARGLVVIVSDFRGARDWEAGLRALRARHGVLAVEIRDPRELELPPVGDVWMVDPETGRQIVVNTSRRRVRKRFARRRGGRAGGGRRGAAARRRRPPRALDRRRLAARSGRPPAARRPRAPGRDGWPAVPAVPPPRRTRSTTTSPRGTRASPRSRPATAAGGAGVVRRSRRDLPRARRPARAWPCCRSRCSPTRRCSPGAAARRARSATRR